VKAVVSLSAESLNRCTQDSKFPTETVLQYLLNEMMTLHLPVTASVKPEYHTKAEGFLGDGQHGFIDFYINGQVQWAIQLLRLRSHLREHMIPPNQWEVPLLIFADQRKLEPWYHGRIFASFTSW
jgi:hypothetical protein